MTPTESPLICVRGDGAVGMAMALSLAHAGPEGRASAPRPRVLWQTPRRDGARAPAEADIRAYALNAGARSLLERLRVWPSLPADAVTAVHDMAIQGASAPSNADQVAPDLRFSAAQQGVPALAWIVDAAALEEALRTALRFAPGITQEPVDAASAIGRHPQAALTVLAEGRDAASREALGVRWRSSPYGHDGLATRIVTELPHHGTAWQWFQAPAVLALLPLDRPEAGHGWGVVWSLPQAEAERLRQMDAAAFEAELQAAIGARFGTLRLAGPRQAWPLTLAQAEPWCGPGWVLVGDAAHRVHPLAGQGLNLGFGDVVALTEVLQQRGAHESPGDERVLRRYERARHAPTQAMARVTDGLWHLFHAPVPPLLAPLRQQGMRLLDAAGPLKRLLVAQALAG